MRPFTWQDVASLAGTRWRQWRGGRRPPPSVWGEEDKWGRDLGGQGQILRWVITVKYWLQGRQWWWWWWLVVVVVPPGYSLHWHWGCVLLHSQIISGSADSSEDRPGEGGWLPDSCTTLCHLVTFIKWPTSHHQSSPGSVKLSCPPEYYCGKSQVSDYWL